MEISLLSVQDGYFQPPSVILILIFNQELVFNLGHLNKHSKTNGPLQPKASES